MSERDIRPMNNNPHGWLTVCACCKCTPGNKTCSFDCLCHAPRGERNVKRFYYQAIPRVTECHDCGETQLCEVVISDPEPETGYVDECAICEPCKNGDTKREDPMGWLRHG
jgi:hypothetical protein